MGLLVVCDKCKTKLGLLLWWLEENQTKLFIETEDLENRYKFVETALYQKGDPKPNNLILCDKCFCDVFNCLKLKTRD